MRDYSNMPVLGITDLSDVMHAKNQILHQEPVILVLPDSFDLSIPEAAECHRDPDSGIHVDCRPEPIFTALADSNAMAGLHELSEACLTSGSKVDVDAERHRVIVHD